MGKTISLITKIINYLDESFIFKFCLSSKMQVPVSVRELAISGTSSATS